MYFEQISLEKVKEQIAKGEISLMPSEGEPETLCDEPIQREEGLKTKVEQKERWIELCEKAAVEQDHQKLLSLVMEISRLLERRERLAGHP